MNSKREKALAKFREGYNCAQSILNAFADDLHLETNTALRISCGFGAGIGRQGEVCGAVTGGVMVLGLRYGRGEADDRSATELTYAKTQQLMDEFVEKHGSFICRKVLQGCDLATEEGRTYFTKQELLNKICVPCVESVVELLENNMEYSF